MKNFLPLLLFVFLSCESNDITSTGSLEGKWVDIKTKTDTLIFDSNIDRDVFSCTAGKKFKVGIFFPNLGQGFMNLNYYLKKFLFTIWFQVVIVSMNFFSRNMTKKLRLKIFTIQTH